MKVIIAGSRSITNMRLVENAVIDSGFDVTEVVCGMARGVDELGRQWAKSRGIPVKEMPANWDMGVSAGFTRNKAMAQYAEALICVHVNTGGSNHMMATAKKAGLKIFQFEACPKCSGNGCVACGECGRRYRISENV